MADNKRISVPLKQAVLDALALARAGKTAGEIRQILEEMGLQSSIYIMLNTLEYLKRGGRVTPAAAAVAAVLRMKPVLQIQGEKLDAFAKARSEKHARSVMIEAMGSDLDQALPGGRLGVCGPHRQRGGGAGILRSHSAGAGGARGVLRAPFPQHLLPYRPRGAGHWLRQKAAPPRLTGKPCPGSKHPGKGSGTGAAPFRDVSQMWTMYL